MKPEIQNWYARLSRFERVTMFHEINRDEDPSEDRNQLMELLIKDESVIASLNGEEVDDDPLITEQFLLSKGWKESESDFILDQWTLEIDFEEPEMLLRWGDYDNHPSYEGAIPTESQYEVLNQLLKLHQ